MCCSPGVEVLDVELEFGGQGVSPLAQPTDDLEKRRMRLPRADLVMGDSPDIAIETSDQSRGCETASMCRRRAHLRRSFLSLVSQIHLVNKLPLAF